MSEEYIDQQPSEQQPAGASEAWSEVVDKMSQLGDAITAWAKAAAHDPENKRHVDELRAGLNGLTARAGEAFETVKESDLGQQVGEAADKAGAAIGEAAEKVTTAAAPHVASAFGALSEAFGKAAHKVGTSVSSQPAPPPAAATPPASPDAPIPAPPIPDDE